MELGIVSQLGQNAVAMNTLASILPVNVPVE